MGLRSFFASDAVTARYDVARLEGRAGGGVIFDTNLLHRASLGDRSPTQTRTAIQLEWHPNFKVPLLSAHPAAALMPCPTIKDAMYDWHQGVPGFALYPPDSVQSI